MTFITQLGRCFGREENSGALRLKIVLLLVLAGTCNAGVRHDTKCLDLKIERNQNKNKHIKILSLHPDSLQQVQRQCRMWSQPILQRGKHIFFTLMTSFFWKKFHPFCTKYGHILTQYSIYRSGWSVFARKDTRVPTVSK